MFKKAYWQTNTIIRGASRVPVFQAHFIFCIGMLGAIMCLVGFSVAGRALKTNLDAIPDGLGLMILGFACFSLSLPLSCIVYLAKELEKTKARVQELEANKA